MIDPIHNQKIHQKVLINRFTNNIKVKKMITRDDARQAIKPIWINKGKPKSDFPEAMDFYNFLRKEHPDLLDFENPNDRDPYQIIKAFIHSYEQ